MRIIVDKEHADGSESWIMERLTEGGELVYVYAVRERDGVAEKEGQCATIDEAMELIDDCEGEELASDEERSFGRWHGSC